MFRLADMPARRLGIRIIAPERPGFGHSTFQKDWNLRTCAADTAELADALGLERFAVAGISGGGPFAAACAALLPERVGAVALVSPIGPLHSPSGPYKIGVAASLTFRLLPKTASLMSALFFLGRLLFLHRPSLIYAFVMRRAAPPDRTILRRRDVRQNLLEGICEGLRPGIRGVIQEMQILGSPWRVPLSAIRAPAVLWQGTEDRNVPVAAALHLAELIPNCRLVKIEGAGHYWMFENIEEVLTTIKNAMRET